MMVNNQIADPAERERYVYITKARCPLCQSDNLKTCKIRRENDGSKTKETKCRDCGHFFYVVVE